MNLKPIEAGCLAVIIKAFVPENNGKVVRVGKFLGDNPPVADDAHMPFPRCWEIDTVIPTDTGYLVKCAPEYNLLRIDGEDFSDETETEEELTENK